MAKFVPMKEAAELLGIKEEKLSNMRSNGEVHGYRDGGSWKFKMEEVERVAGELGVTIGGAKAKPADDEFGLADDMDGLLGVKDADPEDDDLESILVSEEELGHSDESTSSTIIGKNQLAVAADSDLKLSTDSDLGIGGDVGDVGDVSGSDLKEAADSDVSLVLDAGAESDVSLSAGTGKGKKKPAPMDEDLSLPADSDLELSSSHPSEIELGGSANSDMGIGGSDVLAGSGKGKTVGKGKPSPSAFGSDALSMNESEVTLNDDDDLVLGGSGVGSDLTLASDSGINLNNPSDSGLSLEEEPLDLGGSAISSLELPEDDDNMIGLEDSADPDMTTQLKQDEEFLLSPSDEAAGEEDSGSQVIALEDSEALDQDAATMIQSGESPLFAEGDMLGGGGLGGGFGVDPMAAGAGAMGAAAFGGDALGGAPGAMTGAMPGPVQYGPATLPEAPYSIWNVIGLALIVLVMCMSGMLMVDVVRNMWTFNEATTTSVGTSLMDSFVDAAGLKP